MKTIVTVAFIAIVLLAVFPAIMKFVLWAIAAAIVVFLFIKAPRDRS